MGSSIKLFEFVQRCNQIFGIFPYQSNAKLHSIALTQAIWLFSYAQVLFTTVAFFLFEANSMFDYGFIFYLLVTIINCICIFLIFIWQSQNMSKFIEQCKRFIEKRDRSTAAYHGLIEKIELFNKCLGFGICITIALFLLTVAPFAFVRYFMFGMGKDSFYLFLPAWFPFDWKTPFGYLVAWLAQCAAAIALSYINVHFLNFVIGSCWLFNFIAQDITRDVVSFNIDVKLAIRSDKNRTVLTKHFCDMAQTYSDAKQCITGFNKISRYSLFAFFVYDMLGVSSILITIQSELWAEHPNFFEIGLLSILLNWNIVYVFLLCEPGARIINQLDEFNFELNRCDWYLLPMELHRWHMVFISDTQNPKKVSCFANITCERETSKMMINKAFSYFMTLRRFNV